MIEELFRALEESGANAGSEELADILWLAARIGGAEGPAAGDLPDAWEEPEAPSLPEASAAGGSDSGPAEEFYNAADVTDTPVPARHGVDLVRVRRAASLRDPLTVMRALRPLGRSTGRARDTSGELDEELTVRRTVELRLPTPVLRPRRGRWLDLALVVDAHHSMLLWHDLVAELRRVFVQTGIFRDVRTWYLRGTAPDADEPLCVARTPDGEARSVQEVSDPSGRRLVLIVTDTVAGGWASAEVSDMLRQWSTHGPVALLNVLPRRLWDRGAVHPRPVLVRSVGPASPNSSWRLGPATRSRRRHSAPEGITIPVVEAQAASVAVLAKLVAGNGQWMRVPCLTIPRGPAAPEPVTDDTGEVDEILRRFRAGASPVAQRLAGYLSAVPLSLPVMNLVRQIMLPESEHGHLAEVALGGLLVPWEREGVADPDKMPFDFRPGVREALLGGQRRDAITSVQELVRREMGAGVSERGASSGGDFLAGRSGGDGGGSRGLSQQASPFASRDGARVADAKSSGEATAPVAGHVADLAPEADPMPNLVDRYVDEQLRALLARAQQGRSSVALLVGERGAGKTLAIARALTMLPDDWTYWTPRDADELVREAGQLGPRTVVVLPDIRSFVLASVAPPLHVAGVLVDLIEYAERGPVVALGEITPADMNSLTADDSEEALAFGYALGRFNLLRLYPLTTESEVMRHVYEAPPLARSMLRAALDIRRLGHGPDLSPRLLEAATNIYLSDEDREAQPLNWVSEALGYACESLTEGPPIMTTVSRRPYVYRLSDFVEWADRQEVPRIDPPEDLWPVLALLADRRSLPSLARSARERGLYEAARNLDDSFAFLDPSSDSFADVRQLAMDAAQRLVRVLRGTTELGTGILLSDSGPVVMPLTPYLEGARGHRDERLLVQVQPWDSGREIPAQRRELDERSHLVLLSTVSPPWPRGVRGVAPLRPASVPAIGDRVLVVGLESDAEGRPDPVVLPCRVTDTALDTYLLEPADSASWPAAGAAVVNLHGAVIGVVFSLDMKNRRRLRATRISPSVHTATRTLERSTHPALLDPTRSRAVLIGVDRYEEFPELPGAAEAAHALASALGRRREAGIFDTGNVSVVWNRPYRETLELALSGVARQAEHTLFLYHAGHVVETADDAFLTFSDTSRDYPDNSALSIRHLRSLLDESPARFKILVLDADTEHTDRIWSWFAPRVTPGGNWSLLTSHRNSGQAPYALTNDLVTVLTLGVPGGPEFLTLTDIANHIRHPRRRGTDTHLFQHYQPDSPNLLFRNPAFSPLRDRQQEGTVKWFNKERGYGFIGLDDGPDVFVHYTAIDTSGFQSLEAGQRVQLRVAQGEKGPQAANVRLIRSEP